MYLSILDSVMLRYTDHYQLIARQMMMGSYLKLSRTSMIINLCRRNTNHTYTSIKI